MRWELGGEAGARGRVVGQPCREGTIEALGVLRSLGGLCEGRREAELFCILGLLWPRSVIVPTEDHATPPSPVGGYPNQKLTFWPCLISIQNSSHLLNSNTCVGGPLALVSCVALGK